MLNIAIKSKLGEKQKKETEMVERKISFKELVIKT